MNVRVQIDGTIYTVEIGDLHSRPIQAVVDGQVFAVWPEEVGGVVAVAAPDRAEPEKQSPAPTSGVATGVPIAAQANTVTAPLPGDVVIIAVKPGDLVEVGQLLCTVESMKMNNPIRSTQAGVVDQVMIAVGDHVNHGQPLLILRQTSN